MIDGIRYYDDKPDTCRKCFFWKNSKVGVIAEHRGFEKNECGSIDKLAHVKYNTKAI